jgi:glycosyltransferase involved in cell wall biosynthesis
VRVLQLISSAGYYGAENMLLNLLCSDELAVSENLLAIIYNRHLPNTELYERALARGVPAKLIPYQGRIDPAGFREIRQLVSSHDIVHTHGYKADLYGYAAARRERKPIVATCHNWLSGGAMLAAYNFLDRMALKKFDAVGAVSQTIADRLLSLGVPRERVTMIPNGIDVRAFDASHSSTEPAEVRNRQVLGIVARLDMQKGFEYLLNAVAALRHNFPAMRLLIVGEGPDRAKIEEMVRRQNLGSMVTMAGRQTDMPAVYRDIDIFVLPSLNEGLPMTLLEGMAASKPIIATRVGAVPTVITDGETGLLIEPADETGLTTALSRLLADSDLRRRLGQKARAHVEQRYTAAAMSRNYLALYRDVLMRRGKTVASQVPLTSDGPHPPLRAVSSTNAPEELLEKTHVP